jgi:hypothetical protein
MNSREALYYGTAGYDLISLVYAFHPLVSVVVELAIFCLLGGGGRQRQITRTKGKVTHGCWLQGRWSHWRLRSGRMTVMKMIRLYRTRKMDKRTEENEVRG